MQYRKMGSLDWEVSALGFGAMRLPSRRFSLMGADFEESQRIIRYGIDRGINYIDTAWPYHLGESEKILGEILKDGYREKVKLVTKLPMFLVRRTEDFERFLNQQMKRLQTDFLDIYLFHSMNAGAFEKMKRLGLIDKMEEAQRQGRIGHIGFSFHDTQPVFREIIDYYDWDMTQIQYNYMDTAIQATTDGLEYAHSKGIAVVVMEPVKGGTLANPPAEAVEVMDSSSVQRTPVDWALQFIWNKPEVATVLSGMSNMQQVVENCDSAERSGINSLSGEENEVIDRLAGIYRKKILVPCTACEYCMPCPHGVNIPQNFAILNALSLEQSGIRRFQTRRSYRKLVGDPDQVNKNNPNGNGAICTECGVCVEKCPQEINIPVELEKVHAILRKREPISQHFD
ncbi:MAG TPA: aldo/keto reductase [Chloroflexi bacterium]|nr:MAG: aldo/keto reductase [Chloroflexota bacterium]HDN05029.1 aldo/keto reductase [Chloroflexota bacterium]